MLGMDGILKNAKTAGRSLNRKAPNKRLQRRYSASRLQTAVEPNVRKGKTIVLTVKPGFLGAGQESRRQTFEVEY